MHFGNEYPTIYKNETPYYLAVRRKNIAFIDLYHQETYKLFTQNKKIENSNSNENRKQFYEKIENLIKKITMSNCGTFELKIDKIYILSFIRNYILLNMSDSSSIATLLKEVVGLKLNAINEKIDSTNQSLNLTSPYDMKPFKLTGQYKKDDTIYTLLSKNRNSFSAFFNVTTDSKLLLDELLSPESSSDNVLAPSTK